MRSCFRLKNALLWGAALIAIPSSIYGQELHSPKQFFEKGFVNQGAHSASSSSHQSNVTELKHPSSKPSAHDAAASSSSGDLERFGEHEGAFSSSSASASEENSESSEENSEESESSSQETEGTQIKSVSLVINASDPKHFLKHYSELLEITKKYSIPFYDVYVLGDAKALLASRDFLALKRTPQSGNLHYMKKLPKELSTIKKSPAVLIELGTGIVILEAFPSIKKAFNSRGQFIEPVVK